MSAKQTRIMMRCSSGGGHPWRFKTWQQPSALNPGSRALQRAPSADACVERSEIGCGRHWIPIGRSCITCEDRARNAEKSKGSLGAEANVDVNIPGYAFRHLGRDLTDV